MLAMAKFPRTSAKAVTPEQRRGLRTWQPAPPGSPIDLDLAEGGRWRNLMTVLVDSYETAQPAEIGVVISTPTAERAVATRLCAPVTLYGDRQ